jgi:hypothetical protein
MECSLDQGLDGLPNNASQNYVKLHQVSNGAYLFSMEPLLSTATTTPVVAVARGTYIMSREYPYIVSLLLKLLTMSPFVMWHRRQPILDDGRNGDIEWFLSLFESTLNDFHRLEMYSIHHHGE